MVRINIIKPKYLADQHLIAEYAEILMLIASSKPYQNNLNLEKIPKKYCLGTGHQMFFRNKLLYLKKRHELLKKEMKLRGFEPKQSVDLSGFKKSLIDDWTPREADKKIIKKRLVWKINKKPKYYRYSGVHKSKSFFVNLIKKAK